MRRVLVVVVVLASVAGPATVSEAAPPSGCLSAAGIPCSFVATSETVVFAANEGTAEDWFGGSDYRFGVGVGRLYRNYDVEILHNFEIGRTYTLTPPSVSAVGFVVTPGTEHPSEVLAMGQIVRDVEFDPDGLRPAGSTAAPGCSAGSPVELRFTDSAEFPPAQQPYAFVDRTGVYTGARQNFLYGGAAWTFSCADDAGLYSPTSTTPGSGTAPGDFEVSNYTVWEQFPDTESSQYFRCYLNNEGPGTYPGGIRMENLRISARFIQEVECEFAYDRYPHYKFRAAVEGYLQPLERDSTGAITHARFIGAWVLSELDLPFTVATV